MAILALVLTFAAVALIFSARRRRESERAAERAVAEQLLPEIRELLATCESGESSPDHPLSAELTDEMRLGLLRFLSDEPRFAVEAFYGSLSSYRSAQALMSRAFEERDAEEALSLGDRIRAKDQRDRLLKDVYDSGAFAIEKLERLAG